jgi:hypothetical protein
VGPSLWVWVGARAWHGEVLRNNILGFVVGIGVHAAAAACSSGRSAGLSAWSFCRVQCMCNLRHMRHTSARPSSQGVC